MDKMLQLTAVIEREGDGYVATCPELDIVSQGRTVEEARLNLVEAVEGFFEAASQAEVRRRLTINVPVPDHEELMTGTLLGIIRQSGLQRSLFEAD
jgi:predicted RNase H-like HicB family nuclease